MSLQSSFRDLGSETRSFDLGRSAIERLPREILAEILTSLNTTVAKSEDPSQYLANTLLSEDTHPYSNRTIS
jgi:hypothetical protein